MTEALHRTATSADGTQVAYRSVGAGSGLIVVGGAMRTAEDYLPLAHALARSFEVHVMERRGRGSSGPQGPGYSVEKEVEDLQTVQAQTGARLLFGHSYGGLVVLETAKRSSERASVAVYEPGVSIRGSIPTGWIDPYRRLLEAGDRRGAFAWFVRGSGHAPRLVERMPLGYLKLVLRLAIRPAQWQRMEPLLEANLREHEEVRRLDDSAASYAAVAAPVLLLGGRKSPTAAAQLAALEAVLPNSTVQLLDGLDHNAPDEKAPAEVASRLEPFFSRTY